MNALVVGLSYRTGPVSLLERVAVTPQQVPRFTERLLASPHVGAAIVLSTCNRIEVYAGVTAFHGALNDIASALAERAGLDRRELADHLYVHYDADAARHAFRVAAGLDSMVVGEAQILGQLRDAYGLAVEFGSPGRLLHELIQHALRTGKRVRAETGIDRAGQSVVGAALQIGAQRFAAALPDAGRTDRQTADRPTGETPEADRAAGETPDLAGRPALVVGAGSMGALALANLRRAGAGELYVANRSAARAERLADSYQATAVPMTEVASTLAEVDVVVSATASPGHVLDAGNLPDRTDRPLLLLDLALPRDVDPAAARLPGVVLVDIAQLTGHVDEVTAGELRAAEAIVAEELAHHLAELRSGAVAPTVAALRSRADELVGRELRRLRQRRPELTDPQRAEVARTVHRVVQELLHQPSVRVRQLANEPGGTRYADALRELFGLDPSGASAADTLRADPTEPDTPDPTEPGTPDSTEPGTPGPGSGSTGGVA